MKILALISVSAFLILILSAYDDGAPAGYTGAPGENSCLLCHMDFPLNSGSATTSITGISYYAPSQTYALTVSLNPTQALNKNGFELVVLEDAGNSNTGTLHVTDAVNTKIVTGTGKQYLTFTEAGSDLNTWSFEWTAPSTYVGSISFYAAFNDADDGGGPGDDFIYTNSLTVDSTSTIGIDKLLTNLIDFKVFPNPAIYKVQTEYKLNSSEKVEISIIDNQGKNILVLHSETESPGNHTHEFDISEYTPGLYFLLVNVGKERSIYKIIKSTN